MRLFCATSNPCRRARNGIGSRLHSLVGVRRRTPASGVALGARLIDLGAVRRGRSQRRLVWSRLGPTTPLLGSASPFSGQNLSARPSRALWLGFGCTHLAGCCSDEEANAAKPSRRHLIADAAAAPLIGAAKPVSQQHVCVARGIAPAIDPVAAMARECLALHRESERRHRRCGDVETALFDNCKRLKLSKAQQSAQPEACKLEVIGDRFDLLWKDRPRRMRRLRTRGRT